MAPDSPEQAKGEARLAFERQPQLDLLDDGQYFAASIWFHRGYGATRAAGRAEGAEVLAATKRDLDTAQHNMDLMARVASPGGQLDQMQARIEALMVQARRDEGVLREIKVLAEYRAFSRGDGPETSLREIERIVARALLTKVSEGDDRD